MKPCLSRTVIELRKVRLVSKLKTMAAPAIVLTRVDFGKRISGVGASVFGGVQELQ
jgi:hypothetical protein